MVMFRGNEEQFEKYFGDRKYKSMMEKIQKKEYSKEQKQEMLKDILNFIKENDYSLYHDFMDDICEKYPDWFNFIIFDGSSKKCLLEYMKSRNRSRINGK